MLFCSSSKSDKSFCIFSTLSVSSASLEAERREKGGAERRENNRVASERRAGLTFAGSAGILRGDARAARGHDGIVGQLGGGGGGHLGRRLVCEPCCAKLALTGVSRLRMRPKKLLASKFLKTSSVFTNSCLVWYQPPTHRKAYPTFFQHYFFDSCDAFSLRRCPGDTSSEESSTSMSSVRG